MRSTSPSSRLWVRGCSARDGTAALRRLRGPRVGADARRPFARCAAPCRATVPGGGVGCLWRARGQHLKVPLVSLRHAWSLWPSGNDNRPRRSLRPAACRTPRAPTPRSCPLTACRQFALAGTPSPPCLMQSPLSNSRLVLRADVSARVRGGWSGVQVAAGSCSDALPSSTN
eukprot:7122796-Prymnesium_polylepis.3